MWHVGIVNNMAPVAIPGTERQFTQLLRAAAGEAAVRVSWFRLTGAPPDGYGDLTDLLRSDLDALIVTGSEPKADRLPDEWIWRPLVQTIDWAAEHVPSVIFSCLASHAAVLYLDGVERQPQSRKIFGVFRSSPVMEHPLLAGAPPSWEVAHSRWNDLPGASLVAQGYQILAQSAEAGVDTCIKSVDNSLFVFMQSHLEYEPWILRREYQRDVERFRLGHSAVWPTLPAHDFAPEIAAELEALRYCVTPDDMARRRALLSEPMLPRSGQQWAVQFYRNWLDLVAERRGALMTT
jgi:homoserine O-succinyltransferase